MQQQELHARERDETVWIDAWRDLRQLLLHYAEISFPINRKLGLLRARAQRIWCGFDGPIEKFVRGLEILVGAIIIGEIFENPGVLRTKRCRLLQVGGRLLPFALTALDRTNGHVYFRRVWQTSLRDGKFVERCLVIALTIIMVKAKREMGFRQVRLQTNCLLRSGTRFFLARRSWIEVVIYPIFNPRQSGKRTGKVRIEFCCFLKKLLGLFCVTAEFVRARDQIVSLEKREVGFAVFGGLALNLGLLDGRQFRLQFARDLLCQICLNREHIG